ncbi:MAG: hypothetical protein HY901_10215 [Deltaproteobacteria bacterium]|nr:hypothetical protein [Deltaproteobacteria bacterium]
MRSVLALVLSFLLPAFALGPATAAADEGTWHLTATAGTEFPVDAGARLTVDGPWRLQLSTSLGVMPDAYLQALNDSMVAFEVYPQTTAALIQSALTNSLIWRTQLGWRPFSSWGFYFQAGYTLATLGGALTGTQALAAATGREPPETEGANRTMIEVEARSTIHMLGGELGYRWLLLDRVAIQFALGGFGTVGASTKLTAPSAPPRAAKALEPYLAEGAQYLDETYRSYVHAGYVSLQVGYRFF